MPSVPISGRFSLQNGSDTVIGSTIVMLAKDAKALVTVTVAGTGGPSDGAVKVIVDSSTTYTVGSRNSITVLANVVRLLPASAKKCTGTYQLDGWPIS